MPSNLPRAARRLAPAMMILAVVLSSASYNPGLKLASAQTVTPTSITLRVGQTSEKIVVKDENDNPVADPQFEDIPANDFVTFDKSAATFSAVKATEGAKSVELKYKLADAPKSQKIDITVLPKIAEYSVTLKYDNKPDDVAEHTDGETIRISQGADWPVEFEATDADDNAINNLTAAVKTGTDKIELLGGRLKARNVGTATINVRAANDAGRDFEVQVLSPIVASSIAAPDTRLTERGTRVYTPTLKTAADGNVQIGDEAYGVTLDVPENGYVDVQEDRKTLVASALDVGTSRPVPVTLRVPVASFGSGSFGRRDTSFDVTVVAGGAYIYFVPPTQPLFPNGSARIDAFFKERDGAPSQRFQVTDWTVEQKNEKYVALAKEGNSVTVLRLDDEPTMSEGKRGEVTAAETRRVGARGQKQIEATTAAQRNNAAKDAQRPRPPSVIAITAVAKEIGGDETVTGKAYVQLREITKFQPLSVKLNVMDDTTAKDLYGGVAASEYYILMVRLFNDLRDDETKRYTGASIIVYSGSVEVAVNLEKQYDKASKSGKLKSASAQPIPSPTPGSPTSYLADGRWYDVDPVEDIYKLIADTDFKHKKGTDDELTLGFNDDPVCEDTITYRPLMFEMVVNTADRREGRSTRAKVFDALELVGLGTSFSSAIRFPRPGRDLPIISDRFTNLLVPGLEKVFPSLAEQHRQNIVSQVMKPIEEVPFGSDITRVLFIPKRPLRGVVPNHKVRINQICPYYFKIKVAVVDKTGQTVVEQGVRR